MTDEVRKSAEQWPSARRMALVLSILRGETSSEQAAREHGLDRAQVEVWTASFLAGGETALAGDSRGEATADEGSDDLADGEAGVWVCALDEPSIAPVLFMQAVCPRELIRETGALWSGVGSAPKALRRAEPAAFLHGERTEVGRGRSRLHLFTTRVGATVPFEIETTLADWRLQVKVAGIVVLVDQRAEEDLSRRLFRSAGRPVNRTMAWAKAQRLPLVVAVMVCDSSRFSAAALRERHDLGSQVPVVMGKVLARRSRPRSEDRGASGKAKSSVLSLLIGGGDLCFDEAFATQVLETLRWQIATTVTP